LTNSLVQQRFFGPATGSLSSESLNSYWQQTSYGLTSAVGQVVGPVALSQGYSCSQTEEMAAPVISALYSTVDFSTYNRLVIIFPSQTCIFVGLSTVGCSNRVSPSKGVLPLSISWLPLFLPGSYLPLNVIAHELGHGLGLGHAGTQGFS